MSIRVFFDWREFWIGGKWSRRHRLLYVQLVPMVGIAVRFGSSLGSFEEPA